MDNSRKDRKLVDSFLIEYEEVLKRVKNEDNIEREVAKFLGISVEKLFQISQNYPKFKLPFICSSLPKILQEKGFEIASVVFCTYHGIRSATRQLVEIDLDKTVEVVTLGQYFVTKKDEKFVVSVDFESNMFVGWIYVYSNEKNKEGASQVITDLDLWLQQNNFLKGKKITSFGKFLKLKKYSWEDIIFSEQLETEIKRNIEKYLLNFKIYCENGLPTKRGILLAGPPGIGKTLLGKVLASTIKNTTFIWVTPKSYNPNHDYINMLFDLAIETAPTILFMEDVDFYGTSRSNGNNSFVLGEFLNKVDGLVENEGVLIIMTTNYPELLDKAIKERPGRFDRLITIPFPESKERLKMLKRFCKDLRVFPNVDWESIVVSTDRFTGAFLKELVITAAGLAIDEGSLNKDGKVILKQEYFDSAIKILKEYSEMQTKKTVGFGNTQDSEELCEEAVYPTEKGDFYKMDTGEIE